MTTETAASGTVGLGRGGRMSRQRKRDAVLRLLRGEDLDLRRTLQEGLRQAQTPDSGQVPDDQPQAHATIRHRQLDPRLRLLQLLRPHGPDPNSCVTSRHLRQSERRSRPNCSLQWKTGGGGGRLSPGFGRGKHVELLKTVILSAHSADDLAAVAIALNARPRKDARLENTC